MGSLIGRWCLRCFALGAHGQAAPPKLTEHQRREALARLATGEERLTEIARTYNVSYNAVELIETQDCGDKCVESLPPMAFCQANAVRKALGEDASTSQSFYADFERDIAGQWLFKMRSAGQIVSLRLTTQEI